MPLFTSSLRIYCRTSVYRLLWLIALVYSPDMLAQSGLIFRDYNQNGTKGTAAPNLEPGVGGIIVKLYINNTTGPGDALIGTTTSTSLGAYNFNGSLNTVTGRAAAAGEQVRIEFEIPATGVCGLDNSIDYTSYAGASYGSSVQFITGTAANVNFAINNPADYSSSTTPTIFVPCYTNGNPLSTTGTIGTIDAFVSFSYGTTGTAPVPTTGHEAYARQIGATWGVAFSRFAQKLFTSAIVKRHTGLGPGGPSGAPSPIRAPGSIYLINPASDATNAYDRFFFSLDAIPGFETHDHTANAALNVRSNTDRGLTGNPGDGSRDPITFGQAGKTGLGDIEVSDDGQYLYTTNLYRSTLTQIDLQNPSAPVNPTASQVKQWYLTADGTAGGAPLATCTGGVIRPWATKVYRGKVYVGAVCTAENDGSVADNPATLTVRENLPNTNLRAYIFEFNPVSGAWATSPVLSTTLSYTKGYVDSGIGTLWQRWTDVFTEIPFYNLADYGVDGNIRPQPILSDIEFDTNGSIILGFNDRTGHQLGDIQLGVSLTDTKSDYNAEIGGDILRAYPTNCTSFLLESNGDKDGAGPYVATTAQKNGQGPGGGEFYYLDEFGTTHRETMMGGLTLLPGSNQVVGPVMDPINSYSGGLYWFNNTTGGVDQSYQLYDRDMTGTFGKANGLGDVELSGTLPSLEIGNRVWRDTDKDGIQDPAEAGIAGVVLQLVNGTGTVVGSVTTTANGTWYFNATNVVDTLGASKPNMLGPQANATYTVRIASSQYAATGGTGALAGLVLTPTDAVGSGLTDFADSDASFLGGFASISLATGSYGQNIHTLDIGLSEPPCTLVGLTVTPASCVSTTNEYTISGTISLTNNTAGGTLTLTDGAKSLTLAVTSGATSVAYSLTGLASGTGSHTVTVTLANCGTATQTYTAPASCSCVPPTLDFIASTNICVGQSASLQVMAMPTGTYTYAWSGPPGATFLPTASASSVTVSGLTPGFQSLTVVVGSSPGCSVRTEVSIQVNALPAVGLSSATICTGGSVSLSTTSGGSSYTLTPGALVNTTGLFSVSPSTSTNYTVQMVDGNGCVGSGNGSVQVNSYTLPPLTSLTICQGQTVGFGYAEQPGTSFVWSTGATSATITTTPAGTSEYAVTANNTATGCTATQSITVTVLPTPAPVIAPASQTICFGQSTSLQISGCDGATINWSGSQQTTTITVTPEVSTVYTVTCSAGQCVRTASAGVQVNRYTLSALPSPTTLCAGQTLTFGYAAQAGTTFLWSNGEITPAISITALATTTYSVTATNGPTGCLDTKSTTISVSPQPAIGITNVACVGLATYTVSFTATPGASVNSNVGTVVGNTVTNVPSGQQVVLTATLDGCPALISTIQNCQSNAATLGNLVWEDTNANGQQDPGEPGIGNVLVTLFINGVASQTLLTAADGSYSFTGLTPGSSVSYSVGFGTPGGFTATVANTGPDLTDSDAVGGISQVVTLTPGETNSSLDAGFYRPASLGDQTFIDFDGNGTQDPGEPALAGVVVTLIQNGVVVGVATTNASGQYSFTGLTPGLPYSVSFTTPASYSATTFPAGLSGSVTLASGQINNMLDAGFRPSYNLSLTKTVLGATVYSPGSQVTYQVTVTNNSGLPVYNVQVEDTLPVGTSFVAGSGFVSSGSGSVGALIAGPLAPMGTQSLTLTLAVSNSYTAPTVINRSIITRFTATSLISSPGIDDVNPGDNLASACISVPIRVCANTSYALSISVVAGQTRYQWYRNDVLVQDNGITTGPAAYTGTTPNLFTATSAGTYRVVVNQDVTNQCTNGLCCPVIIEEYSLPALTLTATSPTCVGVTPQANGQVAITGLGSIVPVSITYQYSVGSTAFNPATALPVVPGTLAGDLVLTTTATGGDTYYLQISGPALPSGERCVQVYTANVPVAPCSCPSGICVPILVKKVASIR